MPTTSLSKDLVLSGWQQCHPTHETNPLEDETHFLRSGKLIYFNSAPVGHPRSSQSVPRVASLSWASLDIDSQQFTQPQHTRTNLIQAATILSYQRVVDTTALVASISTMAKAAYTAQFLRWSTEDLLAMDVPLNRTFCRLLHLPPSHVLLRN